MDLRRATTDDLDRLAELAEALQSRPERHVAYLSAERKAIAAELTDLGDWSMVSSVALHGAEPVGFLVGEVDEEIGRVWWLGPFVTQTAEAGAAGSGDGWARAATALLEHGGRQLPAAVDQEELAVDDRFVDLIGWAPDHGFAVDPASAILTRPLEPVSPRADRGDEQKDAERDADGRDGGLVIRATTPDDAAVVGPLHDRLFPDTHLPGHRLLDGSERLVRLVAEVDGETVGYVALEHTADDEAYIDYLGVDERWRRRGIGRELVEAGAAVGRRLGCRRAALTVRTANDGARALYRSIGFTEERILQPLRRGFRLP